MRSLLLPLGATAVVLAGCSALVTFDESDRPPPPDVGASAGSATAGAGGASAGSAGKATSGQGGSSIGGQPGGGQGGSGQSGAGQAGSSTSSGGQAGAGQAGKAQAGTAGATGPGGAMGGGAAGQAGGSTASGNGGGGGAGKGGAAGGCMGDPDCNDGEPCTTDGCVGGTCKHTPVTPGTACSDGDMCNGAETCSMAGACVAGSPPQVDDNDDCTIDACDAKTGVVHTPKTASDVCGSVCPSTFHMNGHKTVSMCGVGTNNAVVCAPNCGNGFEACGVGCPTGWHATARKCRLDCGMCDKDLGNAVSCERDAKSFVQCGDVCPSGYMVSAPMCSSLNPCYLGPMGTCPANPANLEVTCTLGM